LIESIKVKNNLKRFFTLNYISAHILLLFFICSGFVVSSLFGLISAPSTRSITSGSLLIKKIQ
jgi:hypothetical protein